MDKLKNMRFLLLLPIWGNIIVMTYLKFKSHKVSYIKYKHWMLVGFLMGLMFMVGAILITAFIFVLINRFVNIEEFVFSMGSIFVAIVIGGYLSNIPCLIYINYLIKMGARISLQESEQKMR